MLAPDFLFRAELGEAQAALEEDGRLQLTSYEIASSISYFLLDGPPDEALLAAASEDALRDRAQIEAQVRRLLRDYPQAHGFRRFLDEWLHLDELPSAFKDASAFPGYDDALMRDMLSETHHFVDHVLNEDDASLRTLLSADYSMLNTRLAAWYGVDGGARYLMLGVVDSRYYNNIDLSPPPAHRVVVVP